MNKTLMAITAVLAAMLAVRGIDYVTGDPVSAGVRISDGAEMPLYWGWASIAASLAVAASLVFKKHTALLNSALVCFAINAMFAVQVFDPRMAPVPWPPEDTRLVFDHVGHAALWFVIAATVWWREGINRRREVILERRARGG